MPSNILFNPVPTVAPTGPPDDYQRIQANPEAFGASIARGISHFGQSVEKLGETGMDVATARQHMLNEVHASEVNTWLADQITERHTKFGQLEGKAAYDGLPEYKKDLDKLYQDSMKQAPSLQEQAMLAKTGRALKTRYYGYATQHANSQFRSWADKTAADRATSFGNMAAVALTNNDDQGMAIALNTSDDEVRKLYEQRGWDGEAIRAEVAKNRGRNVVKLVDLAADESPAKAQQLFKSHQAEMDAASQAQVIGKLRGAHNQIVGRSVADEESGHVLPLSKPIADIPGSFTSAIKASEGYSDKPQWDVKQWSRGYGTRAAGPNDVGAREQHDKDFDTEISKAAKFVDSVNPNLDAGSRAALTSLTFNSGEKWATSGLGQAVRDGDIVKARQVFLEYNKKEVRPGVLETDGGLAARRYREAQWFGTPEAPAGGQPLVDKQQAYERVLARTDGYPLLQNAAIARLNQVYAVYHGQTVAKNTTFDLREKDTLAEANFTGGVRSPLTEAEFVDRHGVERGLDRYGQYVEQMQTAADFNAAKTMPYDEQRAVLDRMAPQSDRPGFAAAAQRYQKFQASLDKINKHRAEDPAGSVNDDDAVKAAQAQYDPKKPETFHALVAARLAAQEARGIDDFSRSPMTRGETMALSVPLQRMLPGQETTTLRAVADEVQKRYGDNADKAFEYLLRQHKLDADSARRAVPIIKNLAAGQTPGTPITRSYDQASELGNAEKAVAGVDAARHVINVNPGRIMAQSARGEGPAAAPALAKPQETTAKPEKPVPPAGDIMALRKNPKLQQRFDEKYGPGAAKKILDAYPIGVAQ